MSKSLVYKFESILGHYTRERKRAKIGGNVKKGGKNIKKMTYFQNLIEFSVNFKYV